MFRFSNRTSGELCEQVSRLVHVFELTCIVQCAESTHTTAALVYELRD